jgi:predicted Rossmann fold nucleotide-binding protein DprA/Smf involved in DNA uptake
MDENKLIYIILNTNKQEGSLRLTNRQNYFLKKELEATDLHYIDLYDSKYIDALDLSKLRNSASLKEKIKNLLQDRAEIAWKLENWQQSGIAVITQLDQEYPQRLLERLEDKAPAVIYTLGTLKNLSESGIAVVGSRDIDQNIKNKTRKIAGCIIENGFSVISGGAIGVDIISMQTALDNGGKAIGFLKQNFTFRNLSKSGWNKFIEDGSLTLLTEIPPDEKLDRPRLIAAAMNRNKFIYALAEYGIVIASDSKGGTWQGAEEQIKKYNRNIFVLVDKNITKPGNKKLVEELEALILPETDKEFLPNLNKNYAEWQNKHKLENADYRQSEIDFS